MAKNSIRTSKKDASLASSILRSKTSSKKDKSVAGSDLVNRKK